jgi:chromosome partitioning protein
VQTVVIASQKGGSGKTTLSGHLAVAAECAGAGPVALIDTDPQGSLAAWWNARAENTPLFVKVNPMELNEALEELHSAGVRIAIVDTPPAITLAITTVIASANLVIVPTRPSPHDLRAVGATVDIAEHARKPLIFVLNDATPRARITGEAAVALSQHGTVAPVTLYHRVDYAASMVDGRTVGEVMPQSKSAEEISMLWEYIGERLQKLRGVTDPEIAPQTIAAQTLEKFRRDLSIEPAAPPEKKSEAEFQNRHPAEKPASPPAQKAEVLPPKPRREEKPASQPARKSGPVLGNVQPDEEPLLLAEEEIAPVPQNAARDEEPAPPPVSKAEPALQKPQAVTEPTPPVRAKAEPILQKIRRAFEAAPGNEKRIEPTLPKVRANSEPVLPREEKVEPVWRPSLVYDSEGEIGFVEVRSKPPIPEPKRDAKKVPSEVQTAPKVETPVLREDEEAEPAYAGAERRGGDERRLFREPHATFGAVERRNGPFGRRRSDRTV